MDRARVWPYFDKEHVLYEDDDLIAVHKPAGVPSQAANPDRPDDVVMRLRAFLAERDGRRDPYLGVHQRLDRDTSGVLLFTKRPEVNAALARQFEGRTLKKHYLAAVTGWPAHAREIDARRSAPQGRRRANGGRGRGTRTSAPRGLTARAAAAPPPQERAGGSQRALTHVRVKTRKDDARSSSCASRRGERIRRASSSRTQALRSRGPALSRRARAAPHAPRGGLELDHPRTGKRLVIRDEAPADMVDYVARGDRGASVYDDVPALDRALALAVERRWALGRSALQDPEDRRTTAFRLVNEEGDALPGLAVDVYGDHLVAQLYVGGIWEDAARRDRVLDRLHALGFDGIYLKLRPKQANVLVDTRRDDLAPRAARAGEPTPAAEIEIREEGVPYRVRLGDGLSTGIFLDQRPNRRLVREISSGAHVLNLFSYTCAFSVAAALGGAARTVSVDASVLALERGRSNFEAAGVALGSGPSAAHSFVAEDVFAWLARAATKKERFDVVIVDPPSYSSTKKRRFVAESDYDDLVAMAARVSRLAGSSLHAATIAASRARSCAASSPRGCTRRSASSRSSRTSPTRPIFRRRSAASPHEERSGYPALVIARG